MRASRFSMGLNLETVCKMTGIQPEVWIRWEKDEVAMKSEKMRKRIERFMYENFR